MSKLERRTPGDEIEILTEGRIMTSAHPKRNGAHEIKFSIGRISRDIYTMVLNVDEALCLAEGLLVLANKEHLDEVCT